jgi:hypothetical protein
MAGSEPHEIEKLVRYAEGALPAEERTATTRHLEDCASCREFLSFVDDFNGALRDAKPSRQDPDEPCPDSSLIIALEADELDQLAAEQVRAHLLFCSTCLEEFFLLRRLAREEAEAAPFRQQIEKLKEFLLDLGRAYGVGALLGPFRIIAETPAFALRSGAAPDRTSKTVEVTIGGNSYGVELAVSSEGIVSCSVAGFRTPVKTPLNIVIRSDSCEELVSARTDNFGNVKCTIPRGQVPAELYLLTLELGGSEQDLLFRVGGEDVPV